MTPGGGRAVDDRRGFALVHGVVCLIILMTGAAVGAGNAMVMSETSARYTDDVLPGLDEEPDAEYPEGGDAALAALESALDRLSRRTEEANRLADEWSRQSLGDDGVAGTIFVIAAYAVRRLQVEGAPAEVVDGPD
ncbi:hypothetical protein ACH46_14650 [Gordonia phthalatica]|uniref:Uncharacterized protein n=1 Tax=Gordonia phthalatica TaxID=1136941 RepID=A0A0N9NIU7_9ACTN|nr:hypothetical protein ACH46_14650 [Gordonia phthalatica]